MQELVGQFVRADHSAPRTEIQSVRSAAEVCRSPTGFLHNLPRNAPFVAI